MMPEKILDWETWFTSTPLSPFIEKLDTLDPEKVKGTNRWKYVTPIYRFLVWDIITMFRWIGQTLRRLNRDFHNVINDDHRPKKEPEDNYFNVLFLVNIDFNTLIGFLGILLEKVARLLYNSTEGNRPYSIRFSKWRDDMVNGKYLVPNDLEELMRKTLWYSKFEKLRNKYTIHYGYSIGGIVDNTKIQLLSHNEEDKEILYNIDDMQELCYDVISFFEELNKFLCENFDSLPIKIKKNPLHKKALGR